MVKRFGGSSLPSFVDNRATLRRRFRTGLTVIRSDQCPYIEDATTTALNAAEQLGLKSRVVDLASAEEVRQLAPSPYGVFGILLSGEIVSHHYLLEKDLLPRLKKMIGPP